MPSEDRHSEIGNPGLTVDQVVTLFFFLGARVIGVTRIRIDLWFISPAKDKNATHVACYGILM